MVHVKTLRRLGMVTFKSSSVANVRPFIPFVMFVSSPLRVSSGAVRTPAPSYDAFVCSRIDYCNYLLVGLPKVRLSPLHSVLNADTRLIARLPRTFHVSAFTSDHAPLLATTHCSDSTQGSHFDLPLAYWSSSQVYLTVSACLPLPSLFVR